MNECRCVGMQEAPGCTHGATDPIDWPDRFRRAAEVAERREWDEFAYMLRAMGHEMGQWMDPADVKAIGRALLGETDEDGGQGE